MEAKVVEELVEAAIPKFLPENGAVIIIDDQSQEALPIVKALSKRGIATTYYQGSVEAELPIEPLQYVRLLFLDLQIIDTSDEHLIAKSISNVLTRLIRNDNGPYLLVIWSSKYHMYAETVKKEINNHPSIIPACIVHFDKAACLERVNVQNVDSESVLRRLNDLLIGQIADEELELVEKAVIQALNEEVRIEFRAKTNAVNIIENHLKTELEKAGAFHLFVIWENIVKRAAAKMVFDVSSLIPMDKNWEINVTNIFKRLGIARVGQNRVTKEVLVYEALNTLNSSLVDNIESEIKLESLPKSLDLENTVLTAQSVDSKNYILTFEEGKKTFFKNDVKIFGPTETKGFEKGLSASNKIEQQDKEAYSKLVADHKLIPYALNTKLHIELNPSQELIPGNIYYNQDVVGDKRIQYLKNFFKQINGDQEDYFLIDLEVSPICDYAQDRWKRSRVLPGILYPVEHFSNLVSKGNYHYDVEPTFSIDGKQYRLMFDFLLFNARDKQIARERKVIYRLKRELLLDIIAQLSSHVNRPGISFIS